MELEATVKTENAKVLALAADNVHWAIAATYETYVYKGTKRIATLPMAVSEPQLRFSNDGKQLLGLGLQGTISSKKVSASEMLTYFGRQSLIANAYYPGNGDTAIAFVRYLPPKTLDDTPRESAPDRLLVVDCASGEVLHTLEEKVSLAETMRMAIHQDWVATANDQLRVWNWRTGDLVMEAPLEAGEPFHEMAFSSDGQHLATATRHGGLVTLWDTQTWTMLWHGQLVPEGVHQVAFVPNSTRLMLGGEGGIMIWEFKGMEEPKQVGATLPGNVQDLAISADGSLLYVADTDETRIYRMK